MSSRCRRCCCWLTSTPGKCQRWINNCLMHDACNVCLFAYARHVAALVFAPTPLPARADLTFGLSTWQREGAVSSSAEEEKEARHQENMRLHRLLHPVLLPLCDNKVTAHSAHTHTQAFRRQQPSGCGCFYYNGSSNKVKQCDVSRLSVVLCNGFYLNCVCACGCARVLRAPLQGAKRKGLKLSCHSCHARQAHSI